MRKGLLIIFGTMALAACTKSQPALVVPSQPSADIVGFLRLNVVTDANGESTVQALSKDGELKGQAASYIADLSGFSISVGRTQTLDDLGSARRRYISNVLTIVNNKSPQSSNTYTNLTLYAFTDTTKLGGTNISNIRSILAQDVNPQSAPDITNPNTARCMKPTHSMQTSTVGLPSIPGIDINPRFADLQYVTDADKMAIQSSLGGGKTVLGYGFVAHKADQSRLLAPNETVSSAISYVFDRGIVKTPSNPTAPISLNERPYSYSIDFVVVQDTQTRLSQSVEEVSDPSGYRLFGRKSVLEAANVQVNEVLVPSGSLYFGPKTVLTNIVTAESSGSLTQVKIEDPVDCYAK